MSRTDEVAIRRVFPSGNTEGDKVECLKEHELTILVNERPMYRLICTAENLKELVYGRLYTDRVIDCRDDVRLFFLCETGNTATVMLDADKVPKPLLDMEPSCCSGSRRLFDIPGGRELEPLPSHDVVLGKVFYLAKVFREDNGLHGKTGASHKSILLCTDTYGQDQTYIFEDIGRHNTIDKAVGYALLNDIELEKCMLFTSGRVPVDMIEKVIAAGIPVLISKSVPTLESAHMAQDYGLSLICRAWGDSCEVFTVPHMNE